MPKAEQMQMAKSFFTILLLPQTQLVESLVVVAAVVV